MCVRGAEGLHPSTGWIIVVDILFFDRYKLFFSLTFIPNTIYTTIYGYTDTVIYMKVGVEVESKYVEKSVRFVGLANQVGCVYEIVCLLYRLERLLVQLPLSYWQSCFCRNLCIECLK